MAESVWEFEALEFGPMIVAVDSHGKDLYQDVRRSAEKQMTR
jgi:fumarate hydratase subunit beta